MLVDQIAVFLENRKGRIFALSDLLAKNGVDLIALSIADTNDFGIVRLVTDNNDRALEVLRRAGFTAATNSLIGIEVEDKPGGLAEVLKIFDDNDIDIEYLYSFARVEAKKAIILVKVADTDKTLEILLKHNIKLLDRSI
ncbi:MAG TPA: ACT domain-containing protein [Eubacteriales bacterium]|jgi:hypothetical protein|nr:ACT domain-containing protein [Clostridia bacterium]HRR90283.1 ACT domain-containing protein [Eubacteriales bacterium]HRU84402.1 ACT domain-containing protein [Eubacteriales bacterium]